ERFLLGRLQYPGGHLPASIHVPALLAALWSSRRAEPVGRDRARMDGAFAAAQVQFRRHPGRDGTSLRLSRRGGGRSLSDEALGEPYVSPDQQRQAGLLGMFVFLASEVMLFGGLFAVILVLRILHPREVVEASKQLHVWIGTANTAVLLTSS